MIKNFQELILQIKNQVPIQELISEFITVKKSGRGFVAICPFHDDHHPSLQIHPQKGIFKCFSCGTGGDLITFYSLYNKKKWSEAVNELALKYGLKVEYESTGENKAEIQIKSKLYKLNRAALDFFKSNLYSNSGNEVLSYLINKRKLNQSSIEKFEIGYALNSWDSLLNYFSKEKEYPRELIIASGLFSSKEANEGSYDRFRNRVMFPIFDEKNNIVGFGGRTLNNDDAKYINSPETLIFSKGNLLYGLNLAKEEIKKCDAVILTEGYLDVITAHEKGLQNTVATLGTALTPTQLRLLTKQTESKKIYLCMDSDNAGKKAVESIFKLTQDLKQYLNPDIRVIVDLPAKDLDESLNIEDSERIKEKINNAPALYQFIFDNHINAYKNSKSESTKRPIIIEIIEILISMKDPLEQKENIRYISNKLALDEEALNIMLRNKTISLKRRKIKDSRDEKDNMFTMHSDERFKHAELELLSLYISSFPNDIEELRRELNRIEFLDEKHKLLKDFIDNINPLDASPQKVINILIIEFNQYKNLMSVISDIAWRIEPDTEGDNTNYIKNKKIIFSEAKESIRWWSTHKKSMKEYTELLKNCKDKEEENDILKRMINLIRNNNSDNTIGNSK